MFRRKRARAADEFVTVLIPNKAPNTYSANSRVYLLTPAQAFDLLGDLRAVLE